MLSNLLVVTKNQAQSDQIRMEMVPRQVNNQVVQETQEWNTKTSQERKLSSFVLL